MIDRAVFALGGVRAVLAKLAVLNVLRALLVIGQSWTLAAVIVHLWEGADLNTQTAGIALFFLFFVGSGVLVNVQDSFMERYADTAVNDLRKRLLFCLFNAEVNMPAHIGTGATSTLILEGMDQIETYLRLILPKIVSVVVIPLVLLIPIVLLDWISGVIALVVFPFIILYMIILGHTAQDEAARQHATFQELSNTFVDALRGVDTLKLFGRGVDFNETVCQASERFREATMKTLRVAMLSSAVLDLFSTVSLAAVAIMLGFRLIDATLSFFPALAVLVMVPEYFKPVREFAADYHASLDGKNALISLNEILDKNSSNVKEIKSYKASSCVFAQLLSCGCNMTFEARDVQFSYGDYQALSNISFKVKTPARVGIVGASGAGKSTLISLLGGFISPCKGNFLIDGVPAESLQRADWQRHVLCIPQNPYIFHATLRDNIVFYCPCASDDDVARAVDAMGLNDLIEALPQGLDTLIGEGARVLSGGQAQRIALARAFLDTSRRILLFDEPTAHLDIETELELKERMLPLMEGRLVFFATHRLHWMADMDTILVVEDGRIVETGSPKELSQSATAYARLAFRLGGEVL